MFSRPRMDAKALARLRADRREHGTPGALLALGQFATDDAACAAVTCAMLRDSHQLERALAMTERWKDSRHSGVLVARAAVLCDLGRWQEARALAKRAAACGGGVPAYAFLEQMNPMNMSSICI